MFPVENIRQIAKSRGTSIAEIERETGIGNGTIGKWENSPRSPQFEHLRLIAKYLCCTIDDLYEGEVRQVPQILELNHHVEAKKAMIEQQMQQYPDLLTQKEKELLSYFHMLNEKGQNQAISQLLALTYVPDYQQDTDSAADS